MFLWVGESDCLSVCVFVSVCDVCLGVWLCLGGTYMMLAVSLCVTLCVWVCIGVWVSVWLCGFVWVFVWQWEWINFFLAAISQANYALTLEKSSNFWCSGITNWFWNVLVEHFSRQMYDIFESKFREKFKQHLRLRSASGFCKKKCLVVSGYLSVAISFFDLNKALRNTCF